MTLLVECLAANDLMMEVLVSTPIPDLALELLLTNLRRGLMLRPAARQWPLSDAERAFVCALARQGFLNEYIYGVTAEEERALVMLRDRVKQAALPGSLKDYSGLATLACYVPLHQTLAAQFDTRRRFRPGCHRLECSWSPSGQQMGRLISVSKDGAPR